MAYCPKCKGVMAATDIVCPGCGFDFPPEEFRGRRTKTGFEYSPLADVALVASMIAAALGVILTAFLALVSLSQGQWLDGLVVKPIACLLQIGMLVVFLRVQR